MDIAPSPEDVVAGLPEERRPAMTALRNAVNKNIPTGFAEIARSGMLSWVVPHKLYPAGYHCDPKQPLPFLSVASQKSHIALYHMGLYSSPQLLEWFQAEWPKRSTRKLDMGKSCIRFKKPEDIPVDFLGELSSKMTVREWIEIYESQKPASK